MPRRYGVRQNRGPSRSVHGTLIPSNYVEASIRLRNRDQIVLTSRNTLLVRRATGVAVRLHYTDVATLREDGSIVLNTGGWSTVTTRQRMNAALRETPWRVVTRQGEMLLSNYRTEEEVEYREGVAVRGGDLIFPNLF